jgi:phage shock protein E
MLLSLPELIKQAAQNVRRLDAVAAYAECRQNNGTVVDVREPIEVSEKSADGSINIPRGVLEMKIVDVCPEPQQPVYIHCATGGRATLAAEQLQRIGYSNVTAIASSLDEICDHLQS